MNIGPRLYVICTSMLQSMYILLLSFRKSNVTLTAVKNMVM